MQNEYDIIIAGGGIAGAFAAYKLSQSKSAPKTCLIEYGRPPGKRRKQLEGWLGCFPTGNGRLYSNDLIKLQKFIQPEIISKAFKQNLKLLSNYGSSKVIKSKKPKQSVLNNLDLAGYDIEYNDFIQWKPENVHLLSRGIASKIEANNKINCVFDNEIYDIKKEKNKFVVSTEKGIFYSKKLLLCLGRSGWRMNNNILKELNIIIDNDYSKFGFMAEMPAACLKDWNYSHCSIYKDDIKIGPLSWNGTVIPEDHVDLVIASWRSNEDRWKSEKVAFSVIATNKFKSQGSHQTERLGQLAFILSDNRVGRIRVSEYLNKKNNLSFIPEYHWFENTLKNLDLIFKGFVQKGSLNIPNIEIVTPQININNDLSTDVDGLYVAGESAGIKGILGTIISSTIAAENMCKRRAR